MVSLLTLDLTIHQQDLLPEFQATSAVNFPMTYHRKAVGVVITQSKTDYTERSLQQHQTPVGCTGICGLLLL